MDSILGDVLVLAFYTSRIPLHILAGDIAKDVTVYSLLGRNVL